MRKWMIDVFVTILMFAGTIGAGMVIPRASVDVPAMLGLTNARPGGTSLAFPSGPPPDDTIASQTAACIQQNSPPGVAPEFAPAFCACLVPRQAELTGSGPRRGEAMQGCRRQALAPMAKRNDLATRFDNGYRSACNPQTLDRDGRQPPENIRQLCECVGDRVKADPLRMAEYAYAVGESKSGEPWTRDVQACRSKISPYSGPGWRIESAGASRSAVLELPAHPDIRQIVLSCEGSEMALRTSLWPSGKAVSQIELGISLPPQIVIPLKNGIAKGEDAIKFFRWVTDPLDRMKPEDLSRLSGNFVDSRTKLTFDVLFGDATARIGETLAGCIPKVGKDNFAKPAGADGLALKSALPDRWEYGARSADFWPAQNDKVWTGSAPKEPLISLIRFNCQEKPSFLISGGYIGELTGDKSASGDLSKPHTLSFTVTTASNQKIEAKGTCGKGDGAAFCLLFPTTTDLNSMAASSVLTFAANKQDLFTIPFGAVPNVRKVFPYCAGKPGQAVTVSQPAIADAPKMPQVTAAPAVSIGQTFTLLRSLNVRPDASAARPTIATLPTATRVVIVPGSTNAEWSAISVNGQQVGFVKNSALLANAALASR